MKTIYTIDEIAQKLKVSKGCVHYHMRDRTLKIEKVGHKKYTISDEQVQRFLNRNQKAIQERQYKKDKKCKECIYKENFQGFGTGCGYILKTGEKRGCPVIGCKKFKRSVKR